MSFDKWILLGVGSGYLSVEGGTLDVIGSEPEADYIDNPASIYIGRGSGTGTMSVSGSGTVVNFSAKSVIGDDGTGILNISGGTV